MAGKEKSSAGAAVIGVVLVFIGTILLLETLGILPWNLWAAMWRLWPVLIVIIGLSILLRNGNPVVVGLLVAIILGAGLFLAIWQSGALAHYGRLPF